MNHLGNMVCAALGAGIFFCGIYVISQSRYSPSRRADLAIGTVGLVIGLGVLHIFVA